MIKLFTFSLLCIIAITAKTQNLSIKQKDIKKLYGYMKGSFSSEAQSKNDTAFFNISLTMLPLKIKGQGNEKWLYVEQAMATTKDKPYRQRVYHLYKMDDTTIISKVYEIKNVSTYIVGNSNNNAYKTITYDSLIDRQGCSIYLHKKVNGNFEGSTKAKECLSSLRGASYATSEVVINKRGMVSWDRGWSSNDKQVWGAVKGGYEFVKK